MSIVERLSALHLRADRTAQPATAPPPETVPTSAEQLVGLLSASEQLQPRNGCATNEFTGEVDCNELASLHSNVQRHFAGLVQAQNAVQELLAWPVLYREEALELGLTWPSGLLLHGPPGCGKSLLVSALAADCGANVRTVLASQMYGAYLGESEQRLREAFKGASDDAAHGQTVVLFLDDVDALCPVRHASRPHEARVVAQLLLLMDGLSAQPGPGRVCVIAATNRPNAIDPALRRPGRLDQEVAVTLPGLQDREAILRLHAGQMPLDRDVDFAGLASKSHGFSGADLAGLCREAGMRALRAAAESPALPSAGNGQHLVSGSDFAACLQHMRPSLTRGLDVELDPVSWQDIGGLHEVKRRLRQAVEWPLLHADAFARLNIAPVRGVLLHGPPGCCKTRLARATATASGARLHALNGAQVYSAFVGEGEARLRAAFKRARAVAPAILFLDELDALVGRREEGDQAASGGGVEASERLLSVMLTEMDDLEQCTGVLVLAATNRPQAIDAALLRPGRFDDLLFVPPPDAVGRLETLQIHTRSMPLGADVNLQAVADATELYTGAELEGLCAEAALAALREDLQGASMVSQRHFRAALAGSARLLTPASLQQYAAWGARKAADVQLAAT